MQMLQMYCALPAELQIHQSPEKMSLLETKARNFLVFDLFSECQFASENTSFVFQLLCFLGILTTRPKYIIMYDCDSVWGLQNLQDNFWEL